VTTTRIRLPTFFIAGAPNAGTTSLYYYLRQHPQVYMCPVKEPNFFGAAEFLAARERSFKERQVTRRLSWIETLLGPTERPPTWDDYLKFFRGVRGEIAVGEASVRYLELPGAAGAIRSRIPAARLVFILRHPVEWLRKRYLKTFWRDPPGMFLSRFRAAQHSQDPFVAFAAVGRYATHLQRFFDAFPREQIHVHLYEDFQGDGRAVVRKILAFVGVDPDYPINMSRRHNETGVPRFGIGETLRRQAFGGTAIIERLPLWVRRVLQRAYYRRRPDFVVDPAARAEVIEYYRDEILRTADLIGRDLSAWLR